MKVKKYILSYLFYLLTIVLLFRYIQLDISIEEYMTVWQRLSYALLISIFFYCGSRIFVKDMTKRIKKSWLYGTIVLIFILYVMIVLQLTLFDPALGRMSAPVWNVEEVILYFKKTANLEPFEMMKLYWNAYTWNYITFEQFAMNMAGNVVIMMPMGFFLPILHKKYKKVLSFMTAVMTMILIIECSQAISMRGYFDVDDIILNSIGALTMFLFLKLPLMKKIVSWLKGENV